MVFILLMWALKKENTRDLIGSNVEGLQDTLSNMYSVRFLDICRIERVLLVPFQNFRLSNISDVTFG